METKYVFKNEEETAAFGKSFAEGLAPGSVVALMGDLGAGKTTLTKYIAKGLGIGENISSPTFTIVCEYDSGRLPFYHFDVYRVYDEEELFEIGFDDYIHGKGVCVIEWADLIRDLLPENTVTINLSYGEADGERIAVVSTEE